MESTASRKCAEEIDVIVRKLRLEKGWSQETLAELTGLSVRTIQRIERGGNASIESLNALAAVFQVDISTLSTETTMHQPKDVSKDEREAMEYVRDIKGFYAHLAWYVGFVLVMGIISLFWDAGGSWFLWTVVGWGAGVASHGLAVFEFFPFFGADWEKRQIEKRLRERGH